MLNLAEYRPKADRLSDHLPWAALVAPGVVLNKDGSFQRTFRFRGPDLESATEAELVASCARVNNVLRRLGTGWALFFEAERFAAPEYPQSDFPDGASWLVDEERRARFEDGAALDGSKTANAEHYENAYYLTLLFLAPPDRVASTERALIETGDDNRTRDWHHELDAFVAETNRTYDLLGQVMAEIAPLDDSETLSVQVTSVVRVSDNSFQVKWTEQTFDHDTLAKTERWTAILSIVTKQPATAETLKKNPLGLYVNGLNWSRELDN